MFIWPKNKENFEGVVGSTAKKFFAVIRPNKLWPTGVRQKSSLAVLTRANVEWLRCTRFVLQINDFFQQRNALQSDSSA